MLSSCIGLGPKAQMGLKLDPKSTEKGRLSPGPGAYEPSHYLTNPKLPTYGMGGTLGSDRNLVKKAASPG